jgi:hypothetical protein
MPTENLLLLLVYPLVHIASRSNALLRLFSVLILIALVSLRGSFGSDTLSLYYQLRNIFIFDIGYDYQPLWFYYNKAVGAMGASHSLGNFNLINALFVVPLFYFAARDKGSLNSIKILFLPIIFIDLTTNTQRLAIFLLLFIIALRANKWYLSLPKYMLMGGHFSLIALSIFEKKVMQNIMLLSVFTIPLLVYFGETLILLIDHLGDYQDLDRGSELRGLSDIILLFIIFNYGFFIFKPDIKLFLISIAFSVALFVLAEFNYGVVRVIKLLLYFVILNDSRFSVKNIGIRGFALSIIFMFPIAAYMFSKIIIGFGIYGTE